MPYNVSSVGSPTQKEAEIYRKQLYSWNIKINSLQKIFQSIPDSVNDVEKNFIKLKIKETRDSLSRWDTQYRKDNFNSYISLLMYNYKRDFPTDVLESLYNNLSAKLKESKYGRAVQTQIKFPIPKIGDRYYDFELTDNSDTPFKLSEVKDKYVLLQFAGTGCYGSILSVQHMKEIYSSFSDSVVFVSTFFEPKDKYQKYIQEKEIPWTCIWSPNGKYGETICKYGIVGTPTFYLISPEGKIVSSWFGYEDGIIENKVIEAMNRKTHYNTNPNSQNTSTKKP